MNSKTAKKPHSPVIVFIRTYDMDGKLLASAFIDRNRIYSSRPDHLRTFAATEAALLNLGYKSTNEDEIYREDHAFSVTRKYVRVSLSRLESSAQEVANND